VSAEAVGSTSVVRVVAAAASPAMADATEVGFFESSCSELLSSLSCKLASAASPAQGTQAVAVVPAHAEGSSPPADDEEVEGDGDTAGRGGVVDAAVGGGDEGAVATTGSEDSLARRQLEILVVLRKLMRMWQVRRAGRRARKLSKPSKDARRLSISAGSKRPAKWTDESEEKKGAGGRAG